LSKIGYGHGSEYHLLRWMGRHRHAFDSAVLAAVGRVLIEEVWERYRNALARLRAYRASRPGRRCLHDTHWELAVVALGCHVRRLRMLSPVRIGG